MPHDKNNLPLFKGDRVILIGTIQEITSDQPTYCNITLLTDESMAPEVKEGTKVALSARMVEKIVADDDVQDSARHVVLDKTFRRDIDAIIQRIRKAAGGFNSRQSRERSLTITKLQEAVMWLGMDLKALNEETPGAHENPYPSSKDPSTGAKIEPTADGLKL